LYCFSFLELYPRRLLTSALFLNSESITFRSERACLKLFALSKVVTLANSLFTLLAATGVGVCATVVGVGVGATTGAGAGADPPPVFAALAEGVSASNRVIIKVRRMDEFYTY
jgi:hypothetical protein